MPQELNRNHEDCSVHSKNSEYYQLNSQLAQQQNLRDNHTKNDETYDSGRQRHIYHNTQVSFDEQRQQYTQTAFNDYDAQQAAQQVQQEQHSPQVQPPPAQTSAAEEQRYDYEEASNPGEQAVDEFQRYHYNQRGNPGNSPRNTASKFVEQVILPVSANALQNGRKGTDYRPQDRETIALGRAETPDLMKNSQKIHKGRIRKDKAYGRLKDKKVRHIKITYEGQRKRLQEEREKRQEEYTGESSEETDGRKVGSKKGSRRGRRGSQTARKNNQKLKEGAPERKRLKEGDKLQTSRESGSADKDEEDRGLGRNPKSVRRKERIKHDRKKRLYDSHNIYDTSGAKDIDQAIDEVLEEPQGRLVRKRLQRDGKFQSYTKKITYRGRLKFEKTKTKQKQTQEEYENRQRKIRNAAFTIRTGARLIVSEGRKNLDDETIQEDEDIADLRRAVRRGGRAAAFDAQRRVRSLQRMYNPYARLQYLNEREDYLMYKRKRLYAKDEKHGRREALKEAEAGEQRRKLKKQMAVVRAQEEGNFFRRVKNQFMIKKKADIHWKHVVKRTLTTVSAIGGLLFLLFSGMLFVLVMIAGLTQGAADLYTETVVQADYGVISDATAYYRRLETDMDEYLSDRETLEAELQERYGPDIYEFHYDIAEFGFSNNTLIAYLGAKYNAFTVDDAIKAELDSIFAEMYTLVIETKMEYRDVPDTSVTDPDTGEHPIISELKKICYVTLEKKELEDVVEPRLTAEQRKLYNGYRLSTGGQQVYGPVMQEDWTNKISSNYGDRIHPITGERKFHKGVDIAVPKGTKLYSAVDGTVTTAVYSNSAGNYVSIQSETGWTVTFMHMDSYAVAEGQSIKKGDFVGYSGNTGNSTGPHLHLEVCDASGKLVNPIFIIPQNCHMVKTDAN